MNAHEGSGAGAQCGERQGSCTAAACSTQLGDEPLWQLAGRGARTPLRSGELAAVMTTAPGSAPAAPTARSPAAGQPPPSIRLTFKGKEAPFPIGRDGPDSAAAAASPPTAPPPVSLHTPPGTSPAGGLPPAPTQGALPQRRATAKDALAAAKAAKAAAAAAKAAPAAGAAPLAPAGALKLTVKLGSGSAAAGSAAAAGAADSAEQLTGTAIGSPLVAVSGGDKKEKKRRREGETEEQRAARRLAKKDKKKERRGEPQAQQ